MHKDWTGDFHSVAGCLGASNHSQQEREENDYYATTPQAAEWLLRLESLSDDIWEPACGEGHLAKVFQAYGKNVKATDLIDRNFGRGGVDFLKNTEKFNGDIVTNPPYKFAVPFIEKAMQTVNEGRKVCMFLKVQFMEGIEHRKLFELFPIMRVWVSTRRLQCGKNGFFSDSMVAYAWYVWQKGYKGPTELKWFN